MWGELASHKSSLTHRPRSQGWTSRCPLLYNHVCFSGLWLGRLLHLSLLIVCYAHVFPCTFLFMYSCTWVHAHVYMYMYIYIIVHLWYPLLSLPLGWRVISHILPFLWTVHQNIQLFMVPHYYMTNNWGKCERAPTLLMSIAIMYMYVRVYVHVHTYVSDCQTVHTQNPDNAYF